MKKLVEGRSAALPSYGKNHLFPLTIHRIMDRVPGQVVDYGVKLINAPRQWLRSKGENIRIAVLDTGIDSAHPDLKENIRGGYNFLDNNDKYEDDHGHGTHVSGIIAGSDNGIGIVGVAPKSQLYALKVLDEKGEGGQEHVIAAIEWALDNGIHLLNLSFGSQKPNAKLRATMEKANQAGITFVAAAGNDASKTLRQDSIDYPGRWSDLVLTVAAVDRSVKRAVFSSQGPELFLAAPGVNVLSTYPANRYVRLSGTSMAAPHITGAAALLMAERRKKAGVPPAPAEVRRLMLEHAVVIGDRKDYGYGFFRF
ncbi:S8 family serine peptidase [Heliobacterium gestii]|uniref:S8 family serine peptidase n=1 Tax=Heliomicrobium gestii TaxID=2699 RepID=A0A845LGT1_HELGE|nr:S8 family peptidase [Heliomicrobium gestii]MBM7867244.1 subtilisin [Heliomicrobium gestii]MZP43799.1 S8 family serine peptidase [Heliomicrobium gestii]